MRSTAITWMLTALLAGGLPALASADEPIERLQLTLAGIEADSAAGSGVLSVAGEAQRYDRIGGSTVTAKLALAARVATDAADYKILKSEIALKTEGMGASTITTLAGSAPVSEVDSRETYSFAISSAGPVAQAAIAACNGLSPAERASAASRRLFVNLAVTWRVTTGRFNFKWTNYDRVAPSDDIVNNHDFYGDQATAVAETTIATPVVCQPLIDARGVANLAPAPVAQAALTPKREEQKSPPLGIETASIDGGKGKPQCEGGMVRQLSGGAENYVCLCPGNTERISTGNNAFACEKRFRKR